MRIQHNIMAMNAYRNYTNNVSAMKANLEKLSSGYKINRAGDDAAGLAISEKMRAQITGLQTAQKNAKDGISLVQTAEGALTEVHDMLNRMVELATQSANGTYDNTTDRDQLQKEVDQLRDEINRIADSANFNGIKLLDGSMAAVEGVDGSTTTEAVVGNYSGMDRIITSVIEQGEKAYEVVGEKTILDGNSTNPTKAKFSIDLNTMKFEMGTYYSVKAGASFGLAIGATQFNSTTGKASNVTLEGKVTIATDVAGNYKVGDEFTTKATVRGVEMTVTVTVGSGGKLYVSNFEGGKGITTATNKSYTLYTSKATTAVTGGKAEATKVVGSVPIKNVFSVTINGTKLSTGALGLGSVANGATSTAIASAVAKAIAANNAIVDINGVKWIASAAAGKLTFTQIKDPETAEEAWADFGVKFSIADVDAGGADDFKITLAEGNKTTGGDGKVEVSYSMKGGTFVETAGVAKDNANKANTIFNIREEDLVDGTKIAIGTRTITLAIGPNSTAKEGLSKASGATAQSGYVELDVNDDLNTALGKISEALGSTVDFLILDKNGTEQKIKFQIGVSDSSMGYPTGLAVQRVNTVATDAGTGEKLAFDSIEKLAANFKMRVDGFKTTTTEAVEAKDGLKLQIGDTADSFNQLKVSIKDMHTDAMGIGDISIADQDSAAKAIDAIKAAINYVSDVRGTLGATQNRLDHTINNLSVMTENIQDAESTIRDTDVAEEMMAYTKNNILIQSAQAMLAQANQVPQGVLQLLQ